MFLVPSMLPITTAPATSSSQPNSAVLRCLALQPAMRSTAGPRAGLRGGPVASSPAYSSADGLFMGASLGSRPSLQDAAQPLGPRRAATSGRPPDPGWGCPHPGPGGQRDGCRARGAPRVSPVSPDVAGREASRAAVADDLRILRRPGDLYPAAGRPDRRDRAAAVLPGRPARAGGHVLAVHLDGRPRAVQVRPAAGPGHSGRAAAAGPDLAAHDGGAAELGDGMALRRLRTDQVPARLAAVR